MHDMNYKFTIARTVRLPFAGRRQLAFTYLIFITFIRDDTVCTFKAFEVKQCSQLHQSRLCP